MCKLQSGDEERVFHMKKFVESNIPVMDLFFESMRQDMDYQIAFMELYLRKIYQRNHILLTFKSGSHLAEDYSDTCPWIKFEYEIRDIEAEVAVAGLERGDQGSGMSSPARSSRGGMIASRSYSSLEFLGSGSSSGGSAFGNEEQYHTRTSRTGVICAFESMEEFVRLFSTFYEKLPVVNTAPGSSRNSQTVHINALHVIILRGNVDTEEKVSHDYSSFLASQKEQLTS
jgi:hypothetical protein